VEIHTHSSSPFRISQGALKKRRRHQGRGQARGAPSSMWKKTDYFGEREGQGSMYVSMWHLCGCLWTSLQALLF